MFLPLTPVRFLYRAADLYGSRLAVVSGNERYTYQELGDLCERLAAGLARLGVRPGDRVAYLSFNNHQLLAGYFAPLLIRAVFMPLNVRLTLPELRAMLQRSQPRVLLFENEFTRIAHQLREDCPSLQALVDLDFGYAELLSGDCVDRSSSCSISENDTAEVFFTSGTTSAPKLVALTHRSLYLHALAMNTALHQTAVEMHAIPLYHANGWGRPHTVTMCGGTHVLLRRFTPADFFQIIREETVTGTSLVPTMARMLLDASGTRPQSLEHIHLGGAPVPLSLPGELSAAFSCPTSAGYGLSEAGPVVAVSSGVSGNRIIYAPIAGVELKLAADGELLIRADHIVEEPEGWLHTGDVAQFEGGSSFRILDRKKDVIISGGENIASVEIEDCINAHPAVLECGVVAAPDPKWGEMPAAFIVVKPDSSLTPGELTAFLSDRLARFKLPRRFEFVAEPLPRTATGKLLKGELRKRLNGADRFS